MIVQIICNTVMFLVYAANLAFLVYTLIDIPKKLKTLQTDCWGLSDKERAKLHNKRYWNRIVTLFFVNLGAMLINVATCLLDGLSDMENHIVGSALTIAIVGGVSFLFFTIYHDIIERKYHVNLSQKDEAGYNQLNRVQGMVACHGFIATAFAFHTGLVAYTVALLIVL